MLCDAHFVMVDPDGLIEGEVMIMDFQHFGFRHFMKFIGSFATLRLYLEYIQDAAPLIVRQLHFVNCSPFFSRLMVLIRPFLKRQLYDAMHFQTTGYDTLLKAVPRKHLPNKYCGEAGTMEQILKYSNQMMEPLIDYMKDDSNWQLLE